MDTELFPFAKLNSFPFLQIQPSSALQVRPTTKHQTATDLMASLRQTPVSRQPAPLLSPCSAASPWPDSLSISQSLTIHVSVDNFSCSTTVSALLQFILIIYLPCFVPLNTDYFFRGRVCLTDLPQVHAKFHVTLDSPPHFQLFSPAMFLSKY